MKNTKKCENSRQLHIEGYLQEDRVELKGHIGAPSISLTLEKGRNAKSKYDSELLERIIPHKIISVKIIELLRYFNTFDSLKIYA